MKTQEMTALNLQLHLTVNTIILFKLQYQYIV